MSETLTGRELDCAVGERVMGWKRVWLCGWSTGSFLGGHYDSPEECAVACAEYGREGLRPVMLWERDGCTFGKGEDWSPSTTWEGAGLVVERMLERGWSPCISHSRGQWSVLFVTAGCSYDVMGEVGPQAICLCALAALASAALAATETGG
jgi:hypothetical protein